MNKRKFNGYSTLEFIAGFALIAILGTVTLPSHIKTYYSVKEEETKSNLHTISLVLERYSIDHNGLYPEYILGGDVAGWDLSSGCRAVTMPATDNTRPPTDVLIADDYISSYPRNPFLNPGDGLLTTIQFTGASRDPGDGDIRFGYSGEIMGNCLDDPRVLFGGRGQPTNYQWTMYPIPGAYLGVINHNSPNTFFCMGGLPEWSRESMGSSEANGEFVKYYWPGEFFYRAGGDIDPDLFEDNPRSGDTIWDWPYEKINKYMLGAYGSLRTDGLDVIRLTTIEGEACATQGGAVSGVITGQFYRDNGMPLECTADPDFDGFVSYSNPEVFGGGDKGMMPQFPYFGIKSYEWVYGAPDGYPDGIILVITGDGIENEF